MTAHGPRGPRHDAMVLAGGTGARLGGVSKPEITVAERELLDHVLDATSNADRVVVVGPPSLARAGVPTVLEDPVQGGPAAGIAAGLDALDEVGRGGEGLPGWVLVLACDVPRAREIVPALLEAARTAAPEVDLVCVVDDDGRRQSLVALHRRGPLRSAVEGLRRAGGLHGVSVRRLTGDLVAATVPDPDHAGRDADTWEDVRALEDEITRRTP